ncbi:hypothetical protein KCP69_26845 (plasmid) [Salmonella enterica subsp. enterica]|nr:hypothetical protein KCP69_26845 [Salmonella enterica subsp. enterica]
MSPASRLYASFPPRCSGFAVSYYVLCGSAKRRFLLWLPRLMQRESVNAVTYPVASFKGIIRRLPVVFRLIFRRQTASLLLLFYCAAAR